jgi:hypothetical protein
MLNPAASVRRPGNSQFVGQKLVSTNNSQHGNDPRDSIYNDQLVDAPGLLNALWHCEARPSLRWLRSQQRRRTVPYIKISGRVFFSPAAVRTALEERYTIKGRA